MTKAELINTIAASANVPKRDAAAVLVAIADAIKADLSGGFEAVLPEVGKFVLVNRPARTGRNPATGESVKIPESRGVKFKAAKALKDAVAS